MTGPIIIASMSWNDCSGGNIVLHRLCYELRQLGAYAFMVCEKSPGDPYRNPLASIEAIRHPARVAIYPEVVRGNPLGAKKVVRWLLNRKDAFGPVPAYGPDDLMVSYADAFKGDFPQAESLFVFDLFPEWIYEGSFSRFGTCHVIRKGRHKCPGLAPDTELFGPLCAPRMFGQIMRAAETFVSYDTATFLSLQAVLCGAKSYVIPDQGVSGEAWRAGHWANRYGINYGMDDTYGTETREKVGPWLKECKEASAASVRRLLERLS